MQAVILAGGQGTRLYPLTLHTPKPMLPIVGRPLLGYLLQHLMVHGVDEVFITARHLGGAIRRFARDWPMDVPVHVVEEADVRGTAGAVIDLTARLRAPFLVVSGDAVLSLDLAAMLSAHRGAGAVATLAVMVPEERLRFGIVNLRDGLVAGFSEKPGLGDLVPRMAVNSGTYLLEHAALAGLPRSGAVDFAKDVFPRLLARGGRIAAVPTLRFWRDVGTAESFRDAHFEALTGVWPWGRPSLGAPQRAADDVRIDGPVAFGPGVVLDRGTRIVGPSYIGPGVRLGPNTEVSRSVLLDRARTVGRCSLQDAVVDADVVLPAGAAVGGAILGRLTAQGQLGEARAGAPGDIAAPSAHTVARRPGSRTPARRARQPASVDVAAWRSAR